jgi:hypothetical protein
MNMKNESDYKFLCIKIVCGFNQRTLWTMLFINGIFCPCIAFYFCNGFKYLGHVCLKGIWKSALISPHLMWLSNLIGFMVPLLTWLSNLVDYWNEWRIFLLFAHYEIRSPLFKCFLLWIIMVLFLWVMMLVRLLAMLGWMQINQILCWSTLIYIYIYIYIFSLVISMTIESF